MATQAVPFFEVSTLNQRPSTSSMKAWQILERGSLDGLGIVELPDPKPGHGEVLVRIHAVSLNYRDLLSTRVERPGALTPLVPCSDGAGEIIEIGPGVTQWNVGDQVTSCFFQDWDAGEITRAVTRSELGGPLHGVLAEKVVLRANGIVAMPEHLEFDQAATLPCAGLAAWSALVEHGSVTAGETVLLIGTGGVSVFALQFAKMHGARVIVISSSDSKLARARALGADETINRRAMPDWQVRVHELTGRLGVDHVVEVGGAGTLERSLDAVRLGGQIHLLGVLSGFDGKVNPWPLITKRVRLHGIYLGHREMFERMNRALSFHRTAPVIDRIFSFAQAREAFAHMEAAGHFGKIVIRVG
jgi:NADPH:quinone reductase-like Zn-dependent oxidoreductase